VPYDPDLYKGAAPYYARGRAPYSADLVKTLAAEVGFDGAGRLLDVGCGPGTLALELAGHFEEAVGLDPDAEMLAEASRRAAERGVGNIRWVRALAEDLAGLDLGRFKLVTFGQSFHWTDQQRVAEMVFDILEPGGALALIAHRRGARLRQVGPGYPPFPDEAIRAVIARYLGNCTRAGQGFAPPLRNRWRDTLARTRFGGPEEILREGRSDIVRDIEGVLAFYLSTSFAAPHLFGDRLERFKADLRADLASRSPSGLFWEWPGDTEILLARKPCW